MDKDNISEEDKVYSVSEVEGNYYCKECKTEIPVDEDHCPGCKRHVNWDKVNIELHRLFP